MSLAQTAHGAQTAHRHTPPDGACGCNFGEGRGGWGGHAHQFFFVIFIFVRFVVFTFFVGVGGVGAVVALRLAAHGNARTIIIN